MLPERDRRRLPVPTTDDLECVGAGMAQIDVAEIVRIVSDLDLSEPVALGDEDAEPWRIIVDRVDAHPLRRQLAFASGQESDQDLEGIVVVSRRFRRMIAPCDDWHVERFAVLALIVIKDGEGNAALEIRKGQSRLRFRGIAVTIVHRSTCASGQGADDAVEDTDQPLDHAALVHVAAMARTDNDPVLLAAAAEGIALELFGAVYDERSGTPEHRPVVVAKAARAEPIVLGTQRLGEAKRDRERTRLFDRQAKSKN